MCRKHLLCWKVDEVYTHTCIPVLPDRRRWRKCHVVMVTVVLSARLLITVVTIPRLGTVHSVSFCFIFPFQSLRERFSLQWSFKLQVPCILYIGQTYRSSPQYSFYIFSQQIYLIIFLFFLSPSSFIPPQDVLYLLTLPFLVHKIFTLYINGVLNCKCPAPGP